ncbi:hypothetical protein BDD12DRAFT_877063 [Trichophaea hybrida]|nr:hypothetical protein BDD12DRAFT_877063 [Trichophaea hybrida]
MTSVNPKISFPSANVACRPADWTDIGKFLLLNYGLHAVSVATPPGQGVVLSVLQSVVAFGSPLVMGLHSARIIGRYFAALMNSNKDKWAPLQTALRAGALCMVIKENELGKLKHEYSKDLFEVEPCLMRIHGKHPVEIKPFTIFSNSNSEGVNQFSPELSQSSPAQSDLPAGPNLTEPNIELGPVSLFKSSFVSSLASQHEDSIQHLLEDSNRQRLVYVPPSFKLHHSDWSKADIANNRNMVKTMASIVQIIVGAKGLYDAQGHQIQRFGYAAFSFTVIPYILMSLLNLIAALCEPQYPTLYLVKFNFGTCCMHDENTTTKDPADTNKSGGDVISNRLELGPTDTTHNFDDEIIGAVGFVHPGGDHQERLKAKRKAKRIKIIVSIIGVMIVSTIPFIIINILTRFNKGGSTTSQRAWIMLWIVSGNVSPFLSVYAMDYIGRLRPKKVKRTPSEIALMIQAAVVCLAAAIASIGGLVTVIKMILEIGICTKI